MYRKSLSPQAFESLRRDIVRLASDLSGDAESLLQLLRRHFEEDLQEGARAAAAFRAVFTDC